MATPLFETADTPNLGVLTGTLFNAPVSTPTPATTVQPAAQPVVQPEPEPAKQEVDAGALLRELQTGVPAQTQTQTNEPVPTPEAKPTEAAPQSDDAAKKEDLRNVLRGLIKEEFGIDPETFVQERETQKLSNDLNTLETMWGVPRTEVGERLSLISGALSSMDEVSRKAFSTPHTLNILWQAIQAQKATNAPTWQGGQSLSTQPSRTKLTQAAIEAMSKEEYASRQAEILDYYLTRR